MVRIHCKYSKPTAGARVGDLYEICGQAQRSVRCMDNRQGFFKDLLRRDARRTKDKGVTRFEKGDVPRLHQFKEMAAQLPMKFEVVLVQPGVSKSKVSAEQLRLLGVTEHYLKSTYRLSNSYEGHR